MFTNYFTLRMIWPLNWDHITSHPHQNQATLLLQSQVTVNRQNQVTLSHRNLSIPSPLRLKNQQQPKSQLQNTQLQPGQQLNIQPKQLQNIQHRNQRPNTQLNTLLRRTISFGNLTTPNMFHIQARLIPHSTARITLERGTMVNTMPIARSASAVPNI